MGRDPSEFESLRDHRLENWGAWGRQDSCRPDPEACGASVCMDFIPSKDWDEAWGDQDAVPDPFRPPIDHRDADYLDGFIKQLGACHKELIRLNYYRQKKQEWMALNAAVRALLDLIEANRATVRRMRSMGA